MEAPPSPWALGLDRSRLYYEGVVDDLEKTLDFFLLAPELPPITSLPSTSEFNKVM